MSNTDLPTGYRWASAEETESYGADPAAYPEMVVVVRSADSSGQPYTQGEADLALPAPKPKVPPLQMDVTGEYQGNSYPEQREYRIQLRTDAEWDDLFHLSVEDSAGGEVRTMELTDREAEGIIKLAETDHSISVYEDDWSFPEGIERTLAWDLGAYDVHLVLSSGEIDEIAAWLRFAIGEEQWDGGEDWEY